MCMPGQTRCGGMEKLELEMGAEADTYASSSKDQIVGAIRLHVIL